MNLQHDDVLGYAELRNELFQIRFQLQVIKDEDERINLNKQLKEVKQKMAKLLIEHNEEKKKGR